MSNAHKSEAFHEPGPRLAQVGRYAIYESADPHAPSGYVEVFEGEPCGRNRVVQMGPVIRALLQELVEAEAEINAAFRALGDKSEKLPSIIRNPWCFAESWYRPEEIAEAISRRHLGDRLLDLPTDVETPEFATWLCHQYRCAMAKGATLAISAMRGAAT